MYCFYSRNHSVGSRLSSKSISSATSMNAMPHSPRKSSGETLKSNLDTQSVTSDKHSEGDSYFLSASSCESLDMMYVRGGEGI